MRLSRKPRMASPMVLDVGVNFIYPASWSACNISVRGGLEGRDKSYQGKHPPFYTVIAMLFGFNLFNGISGL